MNGETLVLDRTRRASVADYVALTKPGITVMVLFTAAVGFLAADGRDFLRLLQVLVGTALSSAGACTLNMVLERDRDARMRRTQDRPLPSGRVQPLEALAFGAFLSIAGLLLLDLLFSPLVALFSALSLGTYLFFYTPLKTKTTLNTFIGAVTGALPPMIGWVAARGSVDAGAWMLFLILFFWQIPHFLALAHLYREDYARGGFRMLSLEDPEGRSAARQSLLHLLALIFVTLLPATLALAGPVYLIGAILLNAGFLFASVRFLQSSGRVQARNLFLASIAYLPALLALLAWGG